MIKLKPSPSQHISIADQESIWSRLSESGNPLAELGASHNQVLHYLEGAEAFVQFELTYQVILGFLAGRLELKRDDFLPLENVFDSFKWSITDGHGFFTAEKAMSDRFVGDVLDKLEDILLEAPNEKKLVKRMRKLTIEVQLDARLELETKAKLLGAIAVAEQSVAYWNSASRYDFFDGIALERRAGAFWADISGFIAGFTGALTYNANNGSGPDVNPFATGVAVSSLASKAAKELKG